jgi:CheY-like chemotaxis protein
VGVNSQRHLATIQRSGDHLLALIDDILSLARIEAGQLALSPSDFDPGQLATVVVELAQPQALAKNLELALHLDPALPRALRGDAGKLRQVLINLVGNAVKFTAAGVVRVELRCEGSERIAFAVSDTGPGILPAEAAALFTHFGQGSAGRRAGGSGLGLAISQGHVRLMGGSIAVESSPGRGTTLRFSLPFTASEPAASSAPGLASRTGRILVVDDQEENRQLLSEFLGALGHQVRTAEDGERALAEIRGWMPELVLLDMQMPGLDGMGVLGALQGAARRPAVVALTASAFAEERQAILAAGADGFLGKPFRLNVLAELVARHLGLARPAVSAADGDAATGASSSGIPARA